MRAFCTAFWVVLAAGSFIPASASAEVSVSKLLRDIKAELSRAQKEATEDPPLTFDRVELELSVTSRSEAQGGLKISIPVFDSVGGKASISKDQATSQHLHLVFEPEDDFTVSSSRSAMTLAERLIEVKQAIRDTIDDPPEMTMKHLQYSFQFVVVKTEDGRIDLYVLEAAGAISEEYQNRITFYFNDGSM